jgi:predicted transcriptional regulator
MGEERTAQKVDPGLVARIVQGYVRKNRVAVDQLASLISTVHTALRGAGTAPSPIAEVLTPAVPIRRSVQQDHVVCLECGFRGLILRRHLRVRHGLDVAAYRARWKLSPDHPVTAPAYSERRAAMAKQLGLGRRPAVAEPPQPPPPTPTPRPRRSRRPTAS